MLETEQLQELCKRLVSTSYVQQGVQELGSASNAVKDVLSRRRLPETGWSEALLERFLSDLSLMDSNNFHANVGVGEREGRVACPLVSRRNFGLAHGIGRSGDISAEQPKAAGSSLLAKICHFLVLDALHLAGLKCAQAVQVFPLATGMTMSTAFLTCAARSDDHRPRFVIWSRIDQKTCLKSIVAANLTPVVVELEQRGDELVTDVEAIAAHIRRLGAEQVACVVSTTSCFAPRASDDVAAVARLCAAADVPHVVNNAYGVQSAQLAAKVSRACACGRVDLIVQSTDKNFMVPVGGAVVASPKGSVKVLEAMARRYPGRAAVAAHLDLTLTLLYLGRAGWVKALEEREELFGYFKEQMELLASEVGERVLVSPGNPISIALTLDSLGQSPNLAAGSGSEGDVAVPQPEPAAPAPAPCLQAPASAAAAPHGGHCASARVQAGRDGAAVSFMGSKLWQRCVSGSRVVVRGTQKTVAGIAFHGYGSSHVAYPHDYITVAAAIWASKADADGFVAKFKRLLLQQRRSKEGGGVARA